MTYELTNAHQSATWPDDVKRFAFRYLHERNLYIARKSNSEAVHVFVRDLKHYLKIDCSGFKDAQVYRKCESFITYHIARWKEFGFVFEKDKLISKVPQFEAAWISHRSLWIAEAEGGRTGHLIEINMDASKTSGTASTSSEKKRVSSVPHSLIST